MPSAADRIFAADRWQVTGGLFDTDLFFDKGLRRAQRGDDDPGSNHCTTPVPVTVPPSEAQTIDDDT